MDTVKLSGITALSGIFFTMTKVKISQDLIQLMIMVSHAEIVNSPQAIQERCTLHAYQGMLAVCLAVQLDWCSGSEDKNISFNSMAHEEVEIIQQDTNVFHTFANNKTFIEDFYAVLMFANICEHWTNVW